VITQQQNDRREQNPKRRVVVTGIGAVAPNGLTFPAAWSAIVEGAVVAGPVRNFDASGFPCQIAYEVDGFSFDENHVRQGEARVLSRAARYGINAAAEAITAAGLDANAHDPWRTAVCVGIGMTSASIDWYAREYLDHSGGSHRGIGLGPVSRSAMLDTVRNLPYMTTKILERMVRARAGTTTIHTACASSGQSLGEAYEMIARGKTDVVLTGGADCMINPFYFAGFCLLGALSKRNDEPTTASRPFDVGRDGFVLGEGACMLVFEELEHALKRKATILGEVCGYGITESAYRITDLHPEGIGPVEAMQMAIDDAGIAARDVGYINAHGTSTSLNDRIEALSIHKVFGAAPVLVSSTKSMTGHMISAAGAMEFAICVEALRRKCLPPTINAFEKDPACPVTLTPAKVSDSNIEFALSNSVGFGGSNTALVARRWTENSR